MFPNRLAALGLIFSAGLCLADAERDADIDSHSSSQGRSAAANHPVFGISAEVVKEAWEHPTLNQTLEGLNFDKYGIWDLSVSLARDISAPRDKESGRKQFSQMTTLSLALSRGESAPRVGNETICVAVYGAMAQEVEDEQRVRGNGECLSLTQECRDALLSHRPNDCGLYVKNENNPCEGQLRGGATATASTIDFDYTENFFNAFTEPKDVGSTESTAAYERMTRKAWVVSVKILSDKNLNETRRIDEKLSCMAVRKDEETKEETEGGDGNGENNGTRLSGCAALAAAMIFTVMSFMY